MARANARTRLLEGQQIAVTGRLAFITRADCRRLIAAHGGNLTTQVTSLVSQLIVGAGGWPLAGDGRLTGNLRRARALIQQGQDVRIVREQEFLCNLEPAGVAARGHFSMARLTRILNVSPARIRAWVREGMMQPLRTADGSVKFDFCQLAGAKTLCELLRAGVPMTQLRRSARRLRGWIGDAPMAQLRLLARDRQLLVRLDDGQLAESTAQLQLDFSEHPAKPAVSIGDGRAKPDWFAEGCRLEGAGQLRAAARAYQTALDTTEPTAECCFNLANVLFALGDKEAAAVRYRQAIAHDPTCCYSWSNLGVTLVDLGYPSESLAAFRRALELNPRHADAHYNLADALDELGHEDEALACFHAYLRFEGTGIWAEHARRRLRTAHDVLG